MRQPASLLFSVTALCFAALWGGCSPVAWAPMETPHTSSVELNEVVTLELRDGSIVTGSYEAAEDLSDGEYSRFYDRSTAEYASLPPLGQTITYTTSLDESKVWEGNLIGFDQSSLLLSSGEDEEIERVYISSLGSITGREGKRIRRMSLRAMYLNGEIPLRSAVVIRSDGKPIQIPLNEIERIRLSAPSGQSTSASTAWIDAREITWSRN